MTCRKTDVVALATLLFLAVAATAPAAVAIPPAPEHHFNDYAKLVTPADADRLDGRLRGLEQAATVQLVVAVFPELPPSAALEDFTVRTAQAWRVGQQKQDNGVVLFVFVKDRKSRLEVGYGLEGQITDAVAKRILQDVMAPHFKQGQFAAGLEAAIGAIAAAATGAPLPAVASRPAGRPDPPLQKGTVLLLIVLGLIVILVITNANGGGGTYSGGGWSSGSSGWSSSGSSWSGSSGGFSGGGGSFGGGGSSGSW